MNIFLNDDYALHCGSAEMHHGKLVPCFEKPDRLTNIIRAFKENNISHFFKPTDFGLAPILAIHDPKYVEFLQTIYDQWLASGNQGDVIPYIWPVPGLKRIAHNQVIAKVGNYAFSSDTPIMAGTWQAAYKGAQTAISAVNSVINDQQRFAFSLSRPPGHHAHSASYGGYCFLNNAAIAAQFALDNGAKKVAIIDVDFHHGNGTQDIFYERDDVLHISIHGDPSSNFPYYLGYSNELGEGEGLGYNLNLPLPNGITMLEWQQAFAIASDEIKEYDADILIIPLGVDTFIDDPISSFKLTTADYLIMGKLIANLELPSVFLMEGGYDVGPIGQNVFNVLSGFEQNITNNSH
ncbi:histone deacetylase family protein [Gammaproteobacteria bacterium AS21]|jgi:acetoin utilization deacetylase AcuC-like enzyme